MHFFLVATDIIRYKGRNNNSMIIDVLIDFPNYNYHDEDTRLEDDKGRRAV